jgi:hypothetical protein
VDFLLKLTMAMRSVKLYLRGTQKQRTKGCENTSGLRGHEHVRDDGSGLCRRNDVKIACNVRVISLGGWKT